MAGSGSGHTFGEIFLHLNWHCLKDRPLIMLRIEPVLHPYIEDYCAKVNGIHFNGVGGTETHVHLVFQMEPFVPISDFIILRPSAPADVVLRRWLHVGFPGTFVLLEF